ncbi:MAG: anaerobic ribonucleoside-triphosphate reductase activating protein [Burkholderiales bacterium]
MNAPDDASHRAAAKLRIGGLVPFSSVDYPGHLSAVIFCQGCPWRCHYCHNQHLLPSRGSKHVAWDDIVQLLARRRGLLDAVVFSGGEPTLQPALLAAMRVVKSAGFKIGLHTAGIYPKRLAAVLPLVDWIGMDIKAPFAAYPRVTTVSDSGRAARESAELILASGVAHEFRTTVDEALITQPDLAKISAELTRIGAKRHVLQHCRT